MEEQKDIHIAEVFLQFLSVGKRDICEGFKIIRLFYGVYGTRLENVSVAPALCQVGGLAVSGRVHAGFPSPAEEELRDVISFDDYLAPHPETSFLLSVTGDSMSGAGIMEQDLVIVERGRQPRDGDIILAEVDGNWTMKYFRKKGRTVTLEAANPGYPPIVPQTELRVAGVVTALIRKYHR